MRGQIKSPAELSYIRTAAALFQLKLITMPKKSLAQDVKEYEIQAEMERIFRLRVGRGPAYPTVASGKYVASYNYIENNGRSRIMNCC